MGIKYSNAWLQQYMYIPPPFQKGLKTPAGGVGLKGGGP